MKQMPSFTLRSKSSKVPLVFIGDIHFGHENCREDVLSNYIWWVKENNAYVILMGDLLENDIPTHIPRAMWGQVKPPKEQLDEMIKILKPIKNRILCGLSGNHEMRTHNLTNFNPMDTFADKLNFEHLGYWGYVMLRVGTMIYRIAIHHGAGGSLRPDFLLDKAYKVFNGIDLIAIGHCHQLFCKSVSHFMPEGNVIKKKEVYLIRTGGCLDTADYAMEKLYQPTKTGFPIVYFYKKRKIISPNVSGFVSL